MINIDYFYIILSVALSIFFLVKLRYLSNIFKLIDAAGKNKVHIIDTPKFGFFFSLIILTNVFLFSFFHSFSSKEIIITLYILSFSFLGYFDDIYEISIIKRIFFSLVITSVFFFLNPNDYYVSNSYSQYLNYFLLIFFTLGFIHLVNISDGINGLVPSLFLYSCIYYLLKGYATFDTYFLILIFTSIISMAIFLIPNFIGFCFLGNSGSYFVSIIISIFYMELYSNELLEYSDILLIFIIPLTDGLRVTLRRLVKGRNPFHGDLSHVHHLVRNNKSETFIYFFLVFSPSSINFFFRDYTILIACISLLLFFIFFIHVKKIYK